ncbi:protein kinase-like domain, Leucine-rich repeat domain, L domain-like protein [Artemisia annua]|uniref:Protein kinase-like domain, Leucine-rich repeat domain, L domain-like protein n=1 Tax=Artemisia annua TaxID=35608 RepID=A0A2U1MM63_ARTAN|nr:protein kinase-like domain, Leucine-rich repeat domain, L domain-like protein [Artemisia annua]
MAFSVLFKLAVNMIKGKKDEHGTTVFSQQIKAEELAFLEKEDGVASLQIIGKGGCGEVYKTELPEGKVKTIAIKKIDLLSEDAAESTEEGTKLLNKKIDQLSKDAAELTEEDTKLLNKKMRQIKSEIQTVGEIRHKNLLPLLAHVSRPNCHYLVYEFMKNGSLQDILQQVKEGRREFDWLGRYKVALGVASGLEYLHMHHTPRIVHRDLKPANVLLDDDMEARIADFGLAESIPEADTHMTSSKIAGSLGYISPEHYETMIFSDKCDIYSFGVVLTCLVTGKFPSDEFFRRSEFSLRKWMRNVMTSENPKQAIDPKMLGNGYEEQMLSVLRIACFCTLDNPKERPNSKDARLMDEPYFDSQEVERNWAMRQYGPLVIIDNENSFQEPDSFGVSVFKVTKEKPLQKVVRPLVDGINSFEEPDVEVNLFQVNQDNQLQNVGGEPIEQEGDVDITLFKQSDTSHLLNVGDDTIEVNENNVTEENHVETQIPVLDDVAFYTAHASESDTLNPGIPKVTPDSVDDAGNGKKVPQKVASKKTHPTSNKVAADKQVEGTGVDESQGVAVEDKGNQDVATEKQDEFAGVQSQSQDRPSDESQCQSQQQDLSQSQSQVHSSNVQAVSVSSHRTTRRVTRQQAFAGVQSQSQDQPIDESQCQSQQQDLSQSQSQVHSSNVQAVSVSSHRTTRRVTRQQAFAGVQSQSQDQPIDESQCQSQQQDLSQSQAQVHSSNVQAVSVSSQHTTRRVTRQQAFMDRMMPSA